MEKEPELCEACFEKIFGSTRDAVFIHDMEGKIIWVNSRACEMTGYSEKELKEKTIASLRPKVETESFKEHVQTVLKDKGIIFRTKFLRADNTLFEVEVSASLIDEENQIIQGIVRDISKQRYLEEEVNHLFDLSMDMLCVAGFDGFFKEINPAWTRTLGWSKEEILSAPWLSFVHPEDHQATRSAGERLAAGEPVMGFENRFRHKDGFYVWFSWNSVPVVEEQKIFAVVRNITTLKANAIVLQKSQERMNLALSGANLGLWDWNLQTDEVYYSDRWAGMLGYSRNEIAPVSDSWRNLIHPDDRKRAVGAVQENIEGRTVSFDVEFRMRTKSGDWRWILGRGRVVERDREGVPLRMAGTHMDITRWKQAEEELAHMAMHDPLTYLPNRLLFNDRLELAIAHARRHQQKIGVLFLDLDYFKKINDTLGHDVGDQLLKGVSERIHSTLRASDTIARLGGDEFIILLPEIDSIHDAEAVAQKIMKILDEPIVIFNQPLSASISVGISLYPKDGENTNELIKRADIAMYQAKKRGRAQYQVYRAEFEAPFYCVENTSA